MVPLRAIASLRIVTGPQVITRYNNYRSITIDGSPAPGVSSGTALAAMEQMFGRGRCRRATDSNGPARRIRRNLAPARPG